MIGTLEMQSLYGGVRSYGRFLGGVGVAVDGIEGIVGWYEDGNLDWDDAFSLGAAIFGVAGLVTVGWVAVTLGGLGIVCSIVASEMDGEWEDRDS